MSTGTTYSIALDYDGSTVHLCQGGSLVASTSATGNITQAPFEQIVVPAKGPTLWPDGYQYTEKPWPGQIDSIRVSKVARHALSCAMSTAKLTSDANTLLLVNFDTSPDGTQIVYYGDEPISAYLPVRGTNGAAEVGCIYLHDIDLGGPLYTT